MDTMVSINRLKPVNNYGVNIKTIYNRLGNKAEGSVSHGP